MTEKNSGKSDAAKTQMRASAKNAHKKGSGRRRGRILLAVIVDILLIGAGLLIFALFHHVLPQRGGEDAVVLPQPSAAVEAPEESAPAQTPQTSGVSPTEAPAVPADEPQPTEDPRAGMWGAKFAGKFTDGEVIATQTGYQSRDINVQIERVDKDGIIYYVADVYVRNLENFRTALADGEYGRGYDDKAANIANEAGAVAAISGDYYGMRSDGIVIRNGVLYRSEVYEDILIMYNDGRMETFSPEAFNIEPILEGGAYQGWSFGPMLLTDGQPMEEFNSSVDSAHPRSAIGYFEPGHYCFVNVEGRSDVSKGMTLVELSQLFYELGCSEAYNLDGGRTAAMVFGGELVNEQPGRGRGVSDIIYVAEAGDFE